MTKDEALKQIIDLIQPVAALADGTPFEHSEVIQRCVDAVEIALETLAQPEQELVATYTCGVCGVSMQMERPWVGLSDEDITKIDQGLYPTWKDEVQAVEARLKELNNG